MAELDELPFNPEIENFNLLVIDPQNDFMKLPYRDNVNSKDREEGKLAVANSDRDVPRISQFIKEHKENINHVFVSLDTHTLGHIGHSLFIREDQKYGNMFDIKANLNGDFKQKEQEVFKKYLSIYISHLGSTHPAMSWPIHCLEGSDGWKVNPSILEALRVLEGEGKVTYHIKGQNQLAEMYSIMKAEVPVEDILEEMVETGSDEADIQFIKSLMYSPYNPILEEDEPKFKVVVNADIASLKPEQFNQYTPLKTFPSSPEEIQKMIGSKNLQTTFNKQLFKDLTRHTENGQVVIGKIPILVCGEARSHCVRASTRDIVEEIRRKGLQNKVVLIENCASKVVLSNPLQFEEIDKGFINDMKQGTLSFPPYNTTTIMAEEAKDEKKGGKSSRRRHPKKKAGKRRSSRR